MAPKKDQKKKIELVMEEDHMDKLYSSKNPLVSYVHNERLNKIIELIPKKEGAKILDAGCGEGHLLEMISKKVNQKNVNQKNLYGADITKIALEKAKERVTHANFSLQDLSNLDYKDEFFEVVICTEVIEHIPEYKKVINELKRVLKKGGYLIMTFPNEILWTISRFLLGRKPIRVPDHVNSFSSKRIIKCVKLNVVKKCNIPPLPSSLALTRILVFKK